MSRALDLLPDLFAVGLIVGLVWLLDADRRRRCQEQRLDKMEKRIARSVDGDRA